MGYSPRRLVFVLLVGQVNALWSQAQITGVSCAKAAQEFFPHCSWDDYGCFCTNSLFVYIVQNCIGDELNFNSKKMGDAFDQFSSSYCTLHGQTVAGLDAWSPANRDTYLTVNTTTFNLVYEGEYRNLKNKDTSVWLGIGLIFYWAAVCLLSFLHQCLNRIAIRLIHNRAAMRRRSRIGIWIQKNVTLPALFGHRHMQRIELFGGRITMSFASRFQTLVILGYLLIVVIFMLTPYTFMNNDPIYMSRWKQMVRYSSDRAGIIGTIQMPLFVTFALRNNFLIRLTDWPYATFNAYHRALARVTYALFMIHAITKHIFSVSYGGSLVKYYFPLAYFRWGVAAMGLFSLMIAFAMIRSKLYDFFYWFHIVFAITGMACSIMHLNGIGYQEPLYLCFALWGADMLWRLGKILVFNVSLFLPPLQGSHRQAFATMRVFNDEMVQVTITLPVRWVARPGQYVYLHTRKAMFYGGHPFSVVGPSLDGEGLELICKARAGLTHRLRNDLTDKGCKPKYPVTRCVYVEGPYGLSAPVERYDEGIFLAGGIGITGVLQYVKHMALANRPGQIPKQITLLWIIRRRVEAEPVAWRLAELRQFLGVQIHIYCSAEKKPIPGSSMFKEAHGFESVDLSNSEADSMSKSDSHKSASSPPRGVVMSEKTAGAYVHHENSSEATILGGIDIQDHSVLNEIRYSQGPSMDRTDLIGGHRRTNSRAMRKKRASLRDMATKYPAQAVNRLRDSKFIKSGLSDPFSRSSEEMFDMRPKYDYQATDFSQMLSDNVDAISDLFHMGRPDVPHIIQDFMVKSEGSVAVLGCGPPVMMDMLCATVCDNLDKAQHGRVDYFEEAFSW